MKQADIPHTSQNTKMWMQNNAKMNIISLLNNIKKKKERQKSHFQEQDYCFVEQERWTFYIQKEEEESEG